MGFWLGTLIFLAIEIAVYGGVAATTKDREQKPLRQLLGATAIVCCWLLWAIVYLGGVHPLVKPVIL